MSKLIVLVALFSVASGQQAKPPTASSDAAAINWERMKDCSLQADRFIEGERKEGKKGRVFIYFSHYNADSKKCFMHYQAVEVDSANDSSTNTAYVVDAFERGVYGFQMWQANYTRTPPNEPPIACWVIIASGARVKCKSLDEFVSLTSAYMGDGPR